MLPKLKRFRAVYLKLALLFFSLVLALFSIEFGLRIFLPQQLVLIRPDIWVPVEGLGWQYAKNLDTTVNSGERTVRLITDEQGNRIGHNHPPLPQARKVLFIGDSFTTAYQVEYEDTFTALIEKEAQAQLGVPVNCVNAAVGGWGPSHYRIKLEQELARSDWDAVVVALYTGNDIAKKRAQSFSPRKSSVHRFAMPRAFTAAEITENILYPINNILETRSHAFSLLKRRGKFLLMRMHLSAHAFPDVLLTTQKDAPRWEITADICEEMQLLAQGHCPILFLLLPDLCSANAEVARNYASAVGFAENDYDVEQSHRILGELLNQRNITVFDARPSLVAAGDEDADDLYGVVDPHFDLGGHRVVAKACTPRIVELLKVSK